MVPSLHSLTALPIRCWMGMGRKGRFLYSRALTGISLLSPLGFLLCALGARNPFPEDRTGPSLLLFCVLLPFFTGAEEGRRPPLSSLSPLIAGLYDGLEMGTIVGNSSESEPEGCVGDLMGDMYLLREDGGLGLRVSPLLF